MDSFKFALNQNVLISVSGEIGEVIARAEYATGENRYLLRYMAADGRACESWLGESALK